MKIVTFFLPEDYLEILENLVQKGRFPNRSEAIRVAIRDLIKTEYQISLRVEQETDLEEKNNRGGGE